MKTNTYQHQISIKAMLLITAMFFSLGIFAQNSLGNYEIKSLSDNLISSSEEVISSLIISIETDFFYEDQINLEEWMIDLDKFSNNNASSIAENNIFIEEEQLLEDWMISTNWLNLGYEVFYEAPLQLEEWMCCPREWTI